MIPGAQVIPNSVAAALDRLQTSRVAHSSEVHAEKRAVNPADLDNAIIESLQELRTEPDIEEAFLFLQSLLGRLPGKALLRSLMRRVRIFSVEENLQWLVRAIAGSTGSVAPLPSVLVGSRWVVVGADSIGPTQVRRAISAIDPGTQGDHLLARWVGRASQLVANVPDHGLASLLLKSQNLLLYQWDLSADQSHAVLAMGGLLKSEIWLVADEPQTKEVSRWPESGQWSYQRFLAWRALGSITGVVGSDHSSIQCWNDVRDIYAPQGVPPLKVALIS